MRNTGLGGEGWREGARGGIPGGKPVAVVQMNSARSISVDWSNQIEASRARVEIPWRRRDLWLVDEGQARIVCSKFCKASEQSGYVSSGSRFPQEEYAAQ